MKPPSDSAVSSASPGHAGADDRSPPRQPDARLHDGLLTLPGLEGCAGVRHAFETRAGSLEAMLPAPPVRLHQVHGSEVLHIRAGDDLEPFHQVDPADRPPADALITSVSRITLAVSTADCLPILVADPEHGAIAVAHAGWRGVALGVVAATLGAMAREFGSDPARCVVGIGPAIGPCCYDVGMDVVRAFQAAGLGEVAFREGLRAGGGRCDLTAAARAQLELTGVRADRIEAIGQCTGCAGERYWSYRREGDAAGRMLSGIALV